MRGTSVDIGLDKLQDFLLAMAPGDPLTIPYTTFKDQASKGNVASIYSRGTSLEGRLKSPITWPADEKAAKAEAPIKALVPQPRTGDTFMTELPAFVDPGLEKFLIDHGVEISAVPIHEGGAWSTRTDQPKSRSAPP